MVQIPGPGLKVGENPRGLPGGGGGCWCLELTDALLKKLLSASQKTMF